MRPAISFLAACALAGPAAAQDVDYSKRAAPITDRLRAALIGKWTNPVDGLVIDIRSVDPVTGAIGGREWPSSALGPGSAPAGTAHALTGWVSAAPARAGLDNVVPITFSTTLFEYGTLPAWAGFLKDGRIVTMHYLVWPNRTYAWDHISAYQEVWTKLP